MGRLGLALLAALVVALLAPAGASALSCAAPSPGLPGAETVVIGTLVGSEGDRLVVRVTEVLRGRADPVLTLRDTIPSWPIAREPGVGVGRELGLIIEVRDGVLTTNLCQSARPEALRALVAGREPPPPPPSPPPPPAPEISLLVVEAPTARARRGVIRLRLGCLGRCAGPLVVRGLDGSLVARRPIVMENESESVALRLRPAARRLLARRGRLVATVAGQRVTLLR